MNYLLEEAEEPIRKALEDLVARDEERHPYVIIEKVGRPDIFVQFGTYRGVLLFDVPRLGIIGDPTPVALGAVRTISTFAAAFGVRHDERVLIRDERDDRPKGGDKVSLWEKLTRMFSPA